MDKFLKIVGGIIVLLVLIVIILPFVIDPNDYRDEIITAVEKSTGRQLSIDGDLQLSVFPKLGIDINKLQLSNAKGFPDQPFAAIEQASVYVNIMPLLSKRLEASTITLDGLQLNLAKNKQGQTNWQDLATTSEKTSEPDREAAGNAALASLSIGGISINDANISWSDASTGQSFQVRQFQLNTGAIRPNTPIEMAMGFSFDSNQPVMQAKFQLDGTLSLDEASNQLLVNQLAAELEATGDMFSSGALKASLNTDVQAGMDGKSVKLSKLVLKSGELQLTGNFVATNLDSQPAVDGHLNIKPLNLRNWLTSQGITLPEMSNDEALSEFAADIQLNSSGNTSKISKLQIKLDQSNIDGNALVQGQHSEFAINIDQINLDDYLPAAETDSQSPSTPPPAATGGGATTPAGTVSDEPSPLFPVETLRMLDTKGKISIGKLIVSKLSSQDVKVNLLAKDGKINIDKQIGRFYQGSFKGNTRLNVAGNTPKLSSANQLTNIQAGPLLKDLTGQERLTGTGKFNMDIHSSGNSVPAIKRDLDGKLDFQFTDGAVKGINLAKIIRETRAKFEGESLPESAEPEQTDFSELSGSATISDGVLNNNDLLAKSPFLRINGAGTINLVQETLDYTVQATIVETSKGQGGKELEDLRGLNIPVKLTGAYVAPKYQIDWGKVLLSSQKTKVDEKLKEKKQELKDKLKDKLGDKLKGLF
ncbi:MAG: AsmA family protein [Chromatiales bacterium]|jgi:AsmA protein